MNSVTLSKRHLATLEQNSVAAVEVNDNHFITVGKLKDGGTIVTSSVLDPQSGIFRISSLEVPTDPSSKAELHFADWTNAGCTRVEQLPADPNSIGALVLPLPKLPE